MKPRSTFYFLVLSFLFIGVLMQAQPWSYDFGMGTGTHTSGESTSFLPASPSGTTRVRVGTGNGSFALVNPGLPSLGSESELQISASNNGSVNKFSNYGYSGGNTFSIEFKLRFGNSTGGNTAASGEWYFFQGSGISYSDNNGFTTAHVFSGLRFVFSSGGVITVSYRNGSNWIVLSDVSISQGTNLEIEIYGNNSASSASYGEGSQSLAPNTFDLWINRVLVGDDLNKATLPSNTTIDSWMFYGQSSTSNQANIFLDDIIYSNSLNKTLLPVSMERFSASQYGKGVLVSWQTGSEHNNQFFSIERSTDGGQSFKEIGQVEGAGDSDVPLNYRFEDDTPAFGLNYYRLRQVDFDGKFTIHKVVAVDFRPEQPGLNLFPTLVQDELTVQLPQPAEQPAQISIWNQLGQSMGAFTLPAGQPKMTLPLHNLASGPYIVQVKVGNDIVSGIFVKN
ncbi:MAG: hypothetical protein H6562_22905 [Lewinellaceae bacterium]|nr:hypothetical protein [Lewinellaceae bacterium]